MSRLRYHLVAVTAAIIPAIGATGVFAFNTADVPAGLEYNSETKTITLTTDVSTCFEVGEGEEYTLDLAGHKLTNVVPDCVPIWVHNGGKLTITNSDDVYAGFVTNTDDSLYPVVNNESGTLIIEDGFFINENTTTGRYTPIINTTSGDTTINGGTFWQKGDYNAVQANGDGTTTITYGDFKKNNTGAAVVGNLPNANSTINISGGEFQSYDKDSNIIANFDGNTFTVTGGEFSTGEMYTNAGFVAGGYWEDRAPANGEISGIADGYEAIKVENKNAYEVVELPVALSEINLSESEVSTRIGGIETTEVSFNEGFLTDEIEKSEIRIKGSDWGNADVSFVSYFNKDGEYIIDYSTLMVEGYSAGENVYELIVTDKHGNIASVELTVKVADEIVRGDDSIADEDGNLLAQVSVGFENAVEGGAWVSLKSVELTDNLKALDDNLKAIFDISVMDKEDKAISVSGNNLAVWMEINKELISGDYEFFQIAYIKDGKIAEYIDPEWVDTCGMNDEKYCAYFMTTHLSDYGILAANTEFASAEERNAALAGDDADATTPDTGAFTGSTSVVATSVAAAVVAGVAVAVVAGRKFIGRKTVSFDK